MYQDITHVLSQLSLKLGLPIDIVKTILVLVINMPLGAVYFLLKNSLTRHLYSLIVGLLELVFLLQFEATYVILASVITYAAIKLSPKHSFLTSVICSTVTLTIVHLHRFIFDYSSWKVDSSVYMMILVTKLTYYGFSVAKHHQKHSTLSYFSYCFFFPGLLIGPTFSFERFMDFINLNNQYKNIKFSTKNTLRVLIQGLILSVITAIVMPIFDHEWVVRDQAFKSYPLIGKLIAINIIGFFYRVKFYAAWYLAQVTVNISGLSYSLNGQNDSVVGGSIMFEFEPNPKNKTEYWNASIQTWLKVIVYDNIAKLTKNQTVAVFGTFFVSAFWHGIYLTYYFGFFQWAILVQLTKFFYKLSIYLPEWFRSSWMSTALVWVAGTVTMNYIGMAVVLLEWENMVAFYQQLYYCMTIAMVVCLFLSFVVKTPKQHRKQKAQPISTPEDQKLMKKE